MTSLMKSPGYKVGQIFQIDISPSIFELEHQLKAQSVENANDFLSVILTSGTKICRKLKMAAILKILKYWTQLQFYLRYEKIVPNYAKKNVFFMVMTS